MLINRLPKSEPVFVSRSKCDFCGHLLSGADLVPLLSFAYLRGRCRYCRKKLSFKYPAFELFTGLSFVALYLLSFYGRVSYPAIQNSSLALFVFLAVIFSFLIVIFFIDLMTYFIPLNMIVLGAVATAIYLLFVSFEVFFAHFLTGVFGFLFFAVIYLVSLKKGIGLGDVFYGFLMGFILGFPGIIVGLYSAFLTGAIVSIILVLTGRKKLKGGVVPFGPFLVFGTVFSLIWGNAVWQQINAYLGF